MNPERIGKADEVFRAALDPASGPSAAYLVEACAGDEELRREVESLLSSRWGLCRGRLPVASSPSR
ncbi:MAG TPA: hypothetical protein VF064_18435 [Pyrinomonadaceae bacterium]